MKRKRKLLRGHYLTSGFPPSKNFSFHSVVMGYFEKKRKRKQLLTTNLAPLQYPVKSIRKEKPNQKRSMFFSKCVQF